LTPIRDRADAARILRSLASAVVQVCRQEDINLLLTNRDPRRAATLAMGWFSRIESPRLTRLSIAVWQALDGDLQLDEARTASGTRGAVGPSGGQARVARPLAAR
jgi:hypothetical protein